MTSQRDAHSRKYCMDKSVKALLRTATAVVGMLPMVQLVLRACGRESEVLSRWFVLQCQSVPERSFFFGSVQCPVCARCLGIYLGLTSGAAAPILTVIGTRQRWFCAAALAMLVDVAGIHAGLWNTPALVRMAGGVAFGFPACAALLKLAEPSEQGSS